MEMIKPGAWPRPPLPTGCVCNGLHVVAALRAPPSLGPLLLTGSATPTRPSARTAGGSRQVPGVQAASGRFT